MSSHIHVCYFGATSLCCYRSLSDALQRFADHTFANVPRIREDRVPKRIIVISVILINSGDQVGSFPRDLHWEKLHAKVNSPMNSRVSSRSEWATSTSPQLTLRRVNSPRKFFFLFTRASFTASRLVRTRNVLPAVRTRSDFLIGYTNETHASSSDRLHE